MKGSTTAHRDPRAETDPGESGGHPIEQRPVRNFFVRSYGDEHVVKERVRGGERAVSPTYRHKEEAQRAMEFLRQNPDVARVKRAT